MTNAVNIAQGGTNNVSWRNRIINGAMVIDQRYGGGAVSAATLSSGGYLVDRFQFLGSQSAKFSAQQNQGGVTPPAGFSKYLGLTVASAVSIGSSDYFLLRQGIEGFNIADLAWGTSSALPVTLSFRVYSSLTGTFGGVLKNDGGSRSYPFAYSIPAANTWTAISVTVAGDTSGTWASGNTGGIFVTWGLGVGATYSGTAGAWAGTDYNSATGAASVVGTSGATFYITGVQLEAGTTASPFERRDYGRELMMCQRYFYKATVFNTSTSAIYLGYYGGTSGVYELNYPVTMRTTPTATISQPTQVQVYYTSGWTNVTILLYAYNQERSIAVYVSSDHSSNKLMQLSGGSTIPTASVSAEL